MTATQVGAFTSNQTVSAIEQALAISDIGKCVKTNQTGDVTVNGTLSARMLVGDGSGITNLTDANLTVTRWQDSADPSVWWMARGGTNLTAMRISVSNIWIEAQVPYTGGEDILAETWGDGYDISIWFRSSAYNRAFGLVATNLVDEVGDPFFYNGAESESSPGQALFTMWWYNPDQENSSLDSYGLSAQDVARVKNLAGALFTPYDIGACLSATATTSGGEVWYLSGGWVHSNAVLTVTNVIASYNLATGDVWHAISTLAGRVGTNKADMAEWGAWGDGRYMSADGNPDLILAESGRIVAGYGLNMANISRYAYGASQQGYNAGAQTIGYGAIGASQQGCNDGTQNIVYDAYGASQQGYNAGTQTIGVWAVGASQQGGNDVGGVQAIGEEAMGASQQGYNVGVQSIGPSSFGASQRGINYGVQSIENDANGALQAGENDGTQTIGARAFGAEQRGYLAGGAAATNTGVGSIQLLNLTAPQTALLTGHASIGLGACTVTNDQAIVAGDSLASHGNGTVTAVRFFGDGSGITDLSWANFSGGAAGAGVLTTGSVVSAFIANGAIGQDQLADGGVTGPKLAAGAVTASKLAEGSVGTNQAVIVEWSDWSDSRYVKRSGTNALSAPLALQGDVVVRGTLTVQGRLVAALTYNVPQQGDISMGCYTNGVPQ